MKKLLSVIIVSLMMVSLVAPAFAIESAPAAHGAEKGVNVWVKDVTLDVNHEDTAKTVDVYLSFSDNTGFEFFGVYVFYPDCLTYVSSRAMSPLKSSDLTQTQAHAASYAAKDGGFSAAAAKNGFDASKYTSRENYSYIAPFVDAERVDEESDELNPINFTGTGDLIRLRFSYDPTLNPTAEDIKIELVPSNPDNNLDFEGNRVTTYLSDGVIHIENQDVEDPNAPTEPTFRVSEETITEGTETATFTVEILNNPGLYSAHMFILYDKNASYSAYALGDAFTSADFAQTPKTAKFRNMDVAGSFSTYKALEASLTDQGVDYEGKVMAMFMVESSLENEETAEPLNLTNSGTMFTLTLNTASLTEGEYDINLVYIPGSTIDAAYEDVTFDVIHGKLTVTGCQHNYEEIERQAATCTDAGYVKYKCTICQNEYTDVIDALGHDYSEVVTAPTCTEQGYTTHVCSRDSSHNYVDTYVDALDHNYEEIERKAATCEESGYVKYKCTRCDDEYTETLLPLNHDWEQTEVTGNCGEIGTIHYVCRRDPTHTKTETGTLIEHNWVEQSRVDPTCTEGGSVHYKCSRCNEEKDEHINPLNHDFSVEVEVIAPTCTEAGYTVYKCSRCDATTNADYVDPLNHDYVPTVTPPTCTEQGYTTYVCSHDPSHTYVDNYVDALNHDFSVVVEVIAPTCEESGYTVYKCSRCDATTNADYVDPLQHDYVPTVTPPTCTEQGYTTYVCSHDPSHTYVGDYVDPLQHDYVAVTTPPTCTERGYTTYTCTRGDDSYVDNYVDALNHDFSVVVEVIAPTCTESGYTVYKCSRCDATTNANFVDPLNHDWSVTVVNPTCTEDGYTLHECSRDSSHNYTDTVVSKLGHTFTEVYETVPATCESEGYTVYKCIRCDEKETRDRVPALNHIWQESARQDPTCEEDGYIDYVCERDASHTRREILDRLGHEWIEVPGSRVDASCTEPGSVEYYCEHDNTHTKTEVLEPLGHLFEDEGRVIKEATETEEGVAVHHCSRCDQDVEVVIPVVTPEQPDNPTEPTNDNTNNTPGSNDGAKQTGDNIVTLVFIAIIALISGAAVIVAKKKVFNK